MTLFTSSAQNLVKFVVPAAGGNVHELFLICWKLETRKFMLSLLPEGYKVIVCRHFRETKLITIHHVNKLLILIAIGQVGELNFDLFQQL